MRIGRRGLGVLAVGLASAKAGQAQALAGLPAEFARIEAARGGRLGVSVLNTANGWHGGHRRQERFPMCSTFKLVAVAAVLARVEDGHDSLDRHIHFGQEVIVSHSPVTRQHVGAGMTLGELCAATMRTSDNAAANLILTALGGPARLTAWLREIGDPTTRLDRMEPAMNDVTPGDPRDTTTPAAMAETIRKLALDDVLSGPSRRQLVQWMQACETCGTRLRAGLPSGWVAGDRTGTGPRNISNVVGVLWPPGGAAPLVVTAYLMDGSPDGAVRDAALADVARAVTRAWTEAR